MEIVWRAALCLLMVTLGACTRDAPPRPDRETGSPADAGAGATPAEPALAPSPAGPGVPGSPATESPRRAADGGGTLAMDAGGDVAPPAPLAAAVAVVGGQDLPIGRDGSAPVDTGASFRVEIAVPLADGRLALYDEQDAMVTSSGTSEVGTSWTRYRLVPDAPLRPGTTYALRLDGALTREAHDPSGRAYGPLVLTVKTAGERPPAPTRKKRGKPRR